MAKNRKIESTVTTLENFGERKLQKLFADDKNPLVVKVGELIEKKAHIEDIIRAAKIAVEQRQITEFKDIIGLKRGYFVHIKDEGTGEVVIATSNQEAKKLAYSSTPLFLDGEYIDLRARIVANNEQVSDLPIGRMKDMELALRRGFFSAIDGKCEICGKKDYVVCYKDKIVCGSCEDKMEI